MAKRRRKPLNDPPPNFGADFLTGEVGDLIDGAQMPPVKSRGQLTPRPDWLVVHTGSESLPDEARANALRENRPLVPSSEEVAKLPRAAREAFAARCAARVARLRSGATTPEAVAALILAAATVATPVRRQLLCVRRDFDRLTRLVMERAWADDTPVSPDVFGPMWPDGLTPDWAN